MATVVLDPGHGGTKKVGGSSPNNATGPNGLKEKAVTLKVALAAEKALARSRVRVLLTRRKDENLGILDRAKVAKKAHADAFVSIHFNAPPGNTPAQGTETWIGEGYSPPSLELAREVQKRVRAETGYKDRGVKVGNVSGVIRPSSHDPKTAACLVEISFLSLDAEEERRLHEQSYIDALGNATAEAVLTYLERRGLVERPTEALVATEEPEDGASAARFGFAAAAAPQYVGADQKEDRPDDLPFRDSIPGGPGPTDNVPFIDPKLVSERPFSDVGGLAAVDSPSEMLDGWRKLRNEDVALEAAVGRFLTVPAALLQILADRRRAVARVVARGVDYRGVEQPSAWTGTGFLVGKNLLLTNHHVLNSIDVAESAVVEFEYELRQEDLIAGVSVLPRASKTFKVDPRRLFVTSPVDGGLDFTFVWIEDAAESTFGSIPLERASFSVKPGEQAFVIHHPNGQPKQASLDDTDILKIQSTVIHYSSDTEYGSSGAPVFDRQGRLIALHHARDRSTVPLPDGGTTDVVNEGIKIAAIALDLEHRLKEETPDAAMAKTALAAIKGSDTLAGFFGGLGRSIDSATSVEAVVDTYRGTEQDVDIGFWNIEWLATRWRDTEKLEGAARVITDLNLDVWGLSEVSPPAVEALLRKLEELFGETYDYGLSEPDAAEGKQSTAVIWKRKTLKGALDNWPDDVEPLLRLKSNDPRAREEAEHGKIFDRYPALYRFEVIGRRSPFDFYLVPLHLKAMAEGGLRRRLASRILVKAALALMEQRGDYDIIFGGDVNAPLASGDFELLRDAKFTAMGAADEQAGAFSYIKSPKSLIDNIFLSPNLARTIGPNDYFIVAKDRTMDDYKRVSDHRPILIRVSLAEDIGRERTANGDTDLDALLAKLIQETSGAKRPRVARAR